jgi:hypothetical protein
MSEKQECCEQCEDCEYNNICDCNKECSEECPEECSEEDQIDVLRKRVRQLKENRVNLKRKRVSEEVERLSDIVRFCNDYEVVTIENGKPVQFDFVNNELPEAASLSELDDGIYIRFRMKKNNFVDEEEFLDIVEDCFDHIHFFKKTNEFSTEDFYIFYTKT